MWLFPPGAASQPCTVFEGTQSTMLDFAMLAIGVGFFVASIFYVLACERM